MKMSSLLDPNKELAKSSIVWYWVALTLIGISLFICFTENWQTGGFTEAIYDGAGNLTSRNEVSAARTLSIVPQLTSIVWAILIYGALIARRYVRNVSNLMTLLLVSANILFIGSLIESFVPAQSICLFKIFKWEVINIKPQSFLISAVLFAWIGMRALSGAAIVVIGVAFLSRAQDLNIALGLYGTFYVFCGFLSLMVQLKLPYMMPEGGWYMSLLQDFGTIKQVAATNVKALGEAVADAGAVTAKSVAKIAAP